MEKKTVKFVKTHEDAVIPTIAKEGDAGMDLYAIEDTIILPGTTMVVKTGLRCELPPNTEMQIRPRSGMSLKTPCLIKNAPGTIDEGYRGEIGVIAHCLLTVEYHGSESLAVLKHEDGTREIIGDQCLDFRHLDEPVIICKGDRIAQAVIKPVINRDLEIIEASAEELSDTERGEGGYGSTDATHYELLLQEVIKSAVDSIKAEKLFAEAWLFAEAHDLEVTDVAPRIIKGLVKFGGCPCKLDRPVCPCPEHMDEIEKMGHCHCGLFKKMEAE